MTSHTQQAAQTNPASINVHAQKDLGIPFTSTVDRSTSSRLVLTRSNAVSETCLLLTMLVASCKRFCHCQLTDMMYKYGTNMNNGKFSGQAAQGSFQETTKSDCLSGMRRYCDASQDPDVADTAGWGILQEAKGREGSLLGARSVGCVGGNRRRAVPPRTFQPVCYTPGPGLSSHRINAQ